VPFDGPHERAERLFLRGNAEDDFCSSRFACKIRLAFSNSRLRVADKFLPPRLMKYWIMRIPDPNPFGLTSLLSIAPGDRLGVFAEDAFGRKRRHGLELVHPLCSTSPVAAVTAAFRLRIAHGNLLLLMLHADECQSAQISAKVRSHNS
jgi:hypothetical protein